MNEIWCPPCNGNILGVFVAGSPCLVTLLQINAGSIYIRACWLGLGTIILCLV